MVFHAQEHCLAARQQFVQLIQQWEEKDISALSPRELLAGAGILFQESVRIYTHLQAGTVPLSTMSEALFTQFYQRLVRRKGDPEATSFLLGSETVVLRAEKALYDLAAWCRKQPDLANFLRQTSASQIAMALTQSQPPASLTSEDWAVWQAQFEAYLREHGQVTYDLDFANPVTGEWNDSLSGEFLWSNVNLSEAVYNARQTGAVDLSSIMMGTAGPMGCGNATGLLKTGDHVRVDGGQGTVKVLSGKDAF